jgi:hypothetical protein
MGFGAGFGSHATRINSWSGDIVGVATGLSTVLK